MHREVRSEPRNHQAQEDPSHLLRVDAWLDVACVFKTRSEAKRACQGGKVSLNGHQGKPHQKIHIGDTLEITIPGGRRRLFVTGLANTHLPKSQARELYNDVTLPPTAEEQELREQLRRADPVPGLKRRDRTKSDLRDRRALRKIKRSF